jgi:hypothetical protein
VPDVFHVVHAQSRQVRERGQQAFAQFGEFKDKVLAAPAGGMAD